MHAEMFADKCCGKRGAWAFRLVGLPRYMMICQFSRMSRFRFNLPQRIAAVMLALFMAQGLCLICNQPPTDRDEQYARCGCGIWARSSPQTGGLSGCGSIHDGILAYRLAGLPLTVHLLAEHGLDLFRHPKDREAQTGTEAAGSSLCSGELRHEPAYILLLLRLPFLVAGCLLGGGLWWVARRLYGNLGGYTALALYCFSPVVLKSCTAPNPEVLAALGVYGGVYTCIGVAHAMQGPVARWRPRIVLLTVAFGLAAASQIAALLVVALLGLAFMLWVAEGRRRQVLPVVLAAAAGALVLVFACSGFSPAAFSDLFHSAQGFPRLSLEPARRFFSQLGNAGITAAAVVALTLYFAQRRSRYFGNTTPLLCALGLILLVTTGADGVPWLWVLPFLLTFVGGVFADAYEGPRGRLAMGAAGVIVVAQVALCVLGLPGVR